MQLDVKIKTEGARVGIPAFLLDAAFTCSAVVRLLNQTV